MSIVLGSDIKGAYCGGEVKEMWLNGTKVWSKDTPSAFVFLQNNITQYPSPPLSDYASSVVTDSTFPINAPVYVIGQSSGVNYTDAEIINLLKDKTRDFTLDFWFYAERSASSVSYLVAAYDESQSNYVFQVSYDGYYFDCGVGNEHYNTSDVYTATWHHAALVREGNEFRIYVDGQRRYYKLTVADSLYEKLVKFRVRMNDNAGNTGLRLGQIALREGVFFEGSTYMLPSEVYRM